MGQHVRVVGVQLQRPQELPARALVVVPVEARHAQDAVGPVVAVVELDRLAGEIQHLLLGKDPVVPGKAGPLVQVREREPDVGARAVRVPGDRLLKELARLADRRQVGAPQGAPTAQPEIVRLQVLWLAPIGRLEPRVLDAADDGADDAAHHVVLDREDGGARTVVALGPELAGAGGLEQPDREA